MFPAPHSAQSQNTTYFQVKMKDFFLVAEVEGAEYLLEVVGSFILIQIFLSNDVIK